MDKPHAPVGPATARTTPDFDDLSERLAAAIDRFNGRRTGRGAIGLTTRIEELQSRRQA